MIAAGLLLVVPAASAQATSAKIAIAVSLTGPGDTFGKPDLDGAQLAVEEANAGRGPKIEFDVHDDTSNPDKAREIVQQIAAGDALLIVGPAVTTVGLAVAPVCAQAGIACIGPTTTGDSLTDNANFYRAVFSTSDGGEAIANYLRHVLGGTQAVVIYKDDGYGKPFAAGFRRGAERLGLTANIFRSRRSRRRKTPRAPPPPRPSGRRARSPSSRPAAPCL